MRAILAHTARWSSPEERRGRGATTDAEPREDEAYSRPRPAPGAFYAQLGSLFRDDEMAELMRALDG
jgi:hypothetical protein